LPQAHAEGALIVAERLRVRIEQIEIPGFGNLNASMGIATFPTHASSRSELTMAVDSALYSAKRAGRNRVAVFEVVEDNANHPVPAPASSETVEQTL
jgi:diguanylate cyclase (GGDEF)-like protein